MRWICAASFFFLWLMATRRLLAVESWVQHCDSSCPLAWHLAHRWHEQAEAEVASLVVVAEAAGGMLVVVDVLLSSLSSGSKSRTLKS